MSDYCKGCRFSPSKRVGDEACPFTTLYWDFLDRHRDRLAANRRMVLQVRNLDRIADDLTAEIGHDIMPKYLPDGRIIFSSTRQTQSQALLLDENKGAFPAMDEDQNEFAFNLHVMEDDGSGLRQVTFNQSHDLDPSVMTDGKIVFSRWEHNLANNEFNLYRMNPDGSELELLYGQWSHDTGTGGATIQFLQPRETDDGRVMVVARPFTNTEGGGDLIVIDTAQYVENTQPLKDNIGILTGPAQADATINEVVTTPGVPSPGGRYYSAYPIQDGSERLLVSWSQCRLVEQLADDGDPETVDTRIVPCTDENLANVVVPDPDDPVPLAVGEFGVAQPLYGIWIYDPSDETQLVIVPGEEGFMFTEVVSADPRPVPPVVFDGLNDFPLDISLAAAGEALLNVRSVYDFDGAPLFDIAALADPAQTLLHQDTVVLVEAHHIGDGAQGLVPGNGYELGVLVAPLLGIGAFHRGFNAVRVIYLLQRQVRSRTARRAIHLRIRISPHLDRSSVNDENLLGAPGRASLTGGGFPLSHLTGRNLPGSRQRPERRPQAADSCGGTGSHRYVTAGLDDFVKGGAVYHKVF